jgi:UDP-glucuronate 4-epimerase
LRFFTVYGPWGRPDMAPMLFTKALLEERPIEIFNEGRMKRDFTYVDDIAEGVIRVLDRPPSPNPAWASDAPDPATSSAPYRIYNIGNSQPVELLRFVAILEACLGKQAIKKLLPMQPGDVVSTYADAADLERDIGFRPSTPLEEGLRRMVAWYREYYRL